MEVKKKSGIWEISPMPPKSDFILKKKKRFFVIVHSITVKNNDATIENISKFHIIPTLTTIYSHFFNIIICCC